MRLYFLTRVKNRKNGSREAGYINQAENNSNNNNVIITISQHTETPGIVRTVYSGFFKHIQVHSAIFSHVQAY